MLHINLVSLLLFLPKPPIKSRYYMGLYSNKYWDTTISQNLTCDNLFVHKKIIKHFI